ncbi:ndufs4 NADH dehydrogenase Fe-S protein subunit [Marasmius crinis-equi]|uniref:NADH dehydrogenase [ubiquinone] iron-sulfur protein 4, mitochondrial n=1 Tax=Marasmius crinis-equi TaxID=585013 RepID=A0ABR3FZQ7_9AGAR
MSSSLLRSCRFAASSARRTQLALRPTAQAAFNSTSTGTPSIQNTEKVETSVTTPAPARDVMVADVVSGAPVELRHRSVRIYKPTRNTMQSGPGKSGRWRIDFDILQGGGRWENPLMGWASSADYMQGTRLSFRTKEDAMHFAEKQGWDYYVQPETIERIPPKNYSENYLYSPTKLRIQKTNGLVNQTVIAVGITVLCVGGHELMKRARRGKQEYKDDGSLGSRETWGFG